MDLDVLLNYAIAFFTLFSVWVFILLFLKHRDEYNEKLSKPQKTPQVSIVIPAYNEEKYLEHCLKNTLAIDYPKFEVILVDDGSTDSTYKIAKSFKDERLKVYTKKNSGKGATLNFGIGKAKGEILATMDADSYPSKNVLWELLPYFNDPEVMAVSPAVKIKESNSWFKEVQRIEYLMILFSRKVLSFIDSVSVTPGPFSIFRASIFDKIGGFDEHNLVEDQEIALRIQAHNYKIKSSMTADVYTEPPDTMGDLLKQRVRWQRGGIRNYWNYKFMIKPAYGDFGMYFIPLNFITLACFFLLVGLMFYSLISSPYYTRYVWIDAIGLNVTLFTLVAFFVFIILAIFLYLAVSSFKNERVKLRYIFLFMAFYWYLMFGYNMLFLFKEIKRENYSW
ncbi:Glycosyltransferase AglE [Candidatus Bilamarchaeum dharawalense]|uniref:Glycosyltransferase AglE n=1 Tax=Candidatus Bilamarchaeum dharawalense TaxID=2885759 RepID=A0A5E4LQZ0_9ARCH|nr:Glycosyltransferase AglE [Candidatus Bilamarchaeum dharawalense]